MRPSVEQMVVAPLLIRFNYFSHLYHRSEMQIKERFWLVSLLCGMLGIALALI